MSLSFDDKILGEKVNNYCSSSEGSDDSDESNDEGSTEDVSRVAAAPPVNNSFSSQVAKVSVVFRFYFSRLVLKGLLPIIKNTEDLRTSRR